MRLIIDLPERLVCKVLLSAAETGCSIDDELAELLSDVVGLVEDSETDDEDEDEEPQNEAEQVGACSASMPTTSNPATGAISHEQPI